MRFRLIAGALAALFCTAMVNESDDGAMAMVTADVLYEACTAGTPEGDRFCDGVALGVSTGLWYGRFVFGGDVILCGPFEASEADIAPLREAFIARIDANRKLGGEFGPKVMIEAAIEAYACG